jgi:DNA invertase Pin-like site-specific DNA recombinase
MPQAQLPLLPHGATEITDILSVTKADGKFTYFNGVMPVFSHDENDRDSFKMITAQFCVNGNCKQSEISRAFGVTKISVRRAVKKYREEGPRGFFQPRQSRGASVLTPEILEQAQALFDQGKDKSTVAEKLGIKKDTLSKAIRAKKLHPQKKKIRN